MYPNLVGINTIRDGPCTASSTAAVQFPRPPPTCRTGRATRPQGADCAWRSPAHAALACRLSSSRWACTLLAQTPTAGPLSRGTRRAERLAAQLLEEKLGLVGHRENQIRHGGRRKSVLRGKPFVGNLAKRVNPVSDHADPQCLKCLDYPLRGLTPEPTSPSARRAVAPRW